MGVERMEGNCGSDEDWCAFYIRTRGFVARYKAAISTNQRVNFDSSI
jgi:hypothetical protein